MHIAIICAGGVIFFQLIRSFSMSSDTYAGGARARFEAVVAELYTDLFRYAAWLCRDRLIAEEVVQEALLRAWRSFASLRDDRAVKPWLLTIVRRENARYFEKRRIETVDIDSLTEAQTAFLATGDDGGKSDLRTAIFALEDDYREPLVLQVLLGHTTDEIAALMDISSAAVLTRLHRARRKLIERFADSED